MKKLIAIGLSMVMVLGMSSMAFANGKGSVNVKKQHSLDAVINLTASVMEVEEGGTIDLSVVTPKVGSTLVEASWFGTGVAEANTDLVGDNYVSNTIFTAPSVDEDKEFTIGYFISTTAGKSGVVFSGQQETVLTSLDVPENATVATVTVRVKAKTTNNNPQFTLEATYTFSDGSEEVVDISAGAVPQATKKVELEYLGFEDEFLLKKTAEVGDIVYTYGFDE